LSYFDEFTHLLQVNILPELHVLRVDTKNLKPAGGVRNANVDLTIESSESPKSRVDGVGSVGSGHDDNVRACFQPVHEGEELRHDTALNFTVGLEEDVISRRTRKR
jgi:hypothetical protein